MANYTVPGVGQKHASLRNFCIFHVQRRSSNSNPLHTISPRDPSDDYIYGPSGEPIEQISQSSGVPSYLYTDQLGSVVMDANQSGNITATQSYSPYGSVSSTTGTWTTPFGFAGGYTDPTGLIYLINRYYDPATGQFVSVDPYAWLSGQSYGYAENNPSNNSDPLGLCDWWNAWCDFTGGVANLYNNFFGYPVPRNCDLTTKGDWREIPKGFWAALKVPGFIVNNAHTIKVKVGTLKCPCKKPQTVLVAQITWKWTDIVNQVLITKPS